MKKRDRDYRPAAGTVLVREYKGVEYRVIATADGQYDFHGRMYPSLSMIAREITGMRWSGPLFFGLKPPSNAKTKKEIATREGIDNSYVSRMVNLTTLAPDIVAAILDDTLPPDVSLFDLASGMPLLRDEQRARLKLVAA